MSESSKRPASSPLEENLRKRLQDISPLREFTALDIKMAADVIETLPTSLSESSQNVSKDTESIISEKNKITIDDDETDPLVKSLCSEKVQLMFSLMIENALQKLVPHFKERIDRIETTTNRNSKQINKLDKHVSLLRSNLEDSQIRLDEYDQRLRNNNIRITNDWNENNDDQLLNKTTELLQRLDDTITKCDIDLCYRVGIKTNRPRTVFVRFLRKRQKDTVMRNKVNLQNDKNIYINDDLTPFRMAILFEARQLKKMGKIRNAYSLNGNVYIKQLNDLRKQIKLPDQLSSYLDN